MTFHFMALGTSFFICLCISAVCFFCFAKNDFLRGNLLSAAVSISTAVFLGLFPIIAVFWQPYDIVSDIKIWQYLLPPISSLLIIGALFIPKFFAVPTAVLLASVISIFAGNFEPIIFPELPIFINQIISAFILCLFALGWRSISGLNPLPQVQGMTVGIGFTLLYILNCAPLIMGITAAGLTAILSIAYIHSKIQPISKDAAPFLGFIIGWFGLVSYNEYLLPCFITFCMLYLIELTTCIVRKITFLEKYKEIAYNGGLIQAFSSGLSANSIIRIIWSTEILLIIFGLFQINSVNNYSIPVFSGIIVSWQIYRALNWQTASQTLRETNRELINEIKKSFSQFLPSDKNTKDDKTDKD